MTERQKRFIAEYIKDFNGAAAARRAGYSEKGAKQAACALLKDPEIRAEVDTVVRVLAGVAPEEVLRERREVAFSQASDENGAQVKLSSKLRALELLGKHLGMFEGGGGRKEEAVRIVEVDG